MKKFDPAYWTDERYHAYTEVALIVGSQDREGRLARQEVVQQLGADALEFARQLPHSSDETFPDALTEALDRDRVINYDQRNDRYLLAVTGGILASNFLKEWRGDP